MPIFFIPLFYAGHALSLDIRDLLTTQKRANTNILFAVFSTLQFIFASFVQMAWAILVYTDRYYYDLSLLKTIFRYRLVPYTLLVVIFWFALFFQEPLHYQSSRYYDFSTFLLGQIIAGNGFVYTFFAMFYYLELCSRLPLDLFAVLTGRINHAVSGVNDKENESEDESKPIFMPNKRYEKYKLFFFPIGIVFVQSFCYAQGTN